MSRKKTACSDTMVKMTPQNSVEDRMTAKVNQAIRQSGNQAAGSRQQAAGSRQQAAGSRQQAIIHFF